MDVGNLLNQLFFKRKSMKDDNVYVFDDAIAYRLRNLVYNFQAAIDELIKRTIVQPLQDTDVGFEEVGYWEARAALHQRLLENEAKLRGDST